MKTRAVDFWEAGGESPRETFVRDQLSLLAAADGGRAVVRSWRARQAGLSLGRFHRRDSDRDCACGGLLRRLTGGRIVPQGPAIACLTLAAPSLAWLDPAGAALRPEQVLNRALRPILAALRAGAGVSSRTGGAAAHAVGGRVGGVDAFYPGRDLVTVGGHVLAHASFTVLPDGVVLVDVRVADRRGFDDLAPLLERFDPRGVAAADTRAFEQATSFAALTGAALEESGWSERLVAGLRSELDCEVAVTAPCATEAVTEADGAAFAALQAELGPLDDGSARAAEPSMLGVVEVDAQVRAGRLAGVHVTGDLIAPMRTIDELSAALEGRELRPPALRRAVADVLARPGRFVLGLGSLDRLLMGLSAAAPGG